MSQDTSSEVLLLLGRLDGKVDTLFTILTAHASRLDSHEARIQTVEADVITLKTSGSTNKTWLAVAGSVVLAAISAGFTFITEFLK